jgi:hypothetical protein
MTKELFNRAKEILEEISNKEQELTLLEKRAERFGVYIEWMDGRHQPIKANGKIYKKVDIKFNMSERPTDVSVDDLFDITEENKKEFVEFLQKCQKSYLKKIKDNRQQVEELQREFDSLSEETFVAKSA